MASRILHHHRYWLRQRRGWIVRGAAHGARRSHRCHLVRHQSQGASVQPINARAQRSYRCADRPAAMCSIRSMRLAISSSPIRLISSTRRRRLYRHGGGEFGFDLSLRIVEAGIDRLRPGGRLVLYTGTPVIDGADKFHEALQPLARHARLHLHLRRDRSRRFRRGTRKRALRPGRPDCGGAPHRRSA